MTKLDDLGPRQYRALAEMRYRIRRFLAFSETAARTAGVEPQQHQLLLVLKGLKPNQKPTVRTVAQRLQIRHNSAVDLVKRSVERGLVERGTSDEDRREASLRITKVGERLLHRLSVAHRDELRSAAPALIEALEDVIATSGGKGSRASSR